MSEHNRPAYYGVAKGRITGVFLTWEDCEAQVKGYAGATFKKVLSAAEAEDFVNLYKLRASKDPRREESISKPHEGIIPDPISHHDSSNHRRTQSHHSLAAPNIKERLSDNRPLASEPKSTLGNPHQMERMSSTSEPHPEQCNCVSKDEQPEIPTFAARNSDPPRTSNISTTQRSSRLDGNLTTSSIHSSRNMPGAFDKPSASSMNTERPSPFKLNIPSGPLAGSSNNNTRSLYPPLEPLPPSIAALSSGNSSGKASGPTPPIHVSQTTLPAFVPAKRSIPSSSAVLPANNGDNLKSDKYIIYCDGACKNNGQARPVAGIGVWWGNGDSRNLAERCPGEQTNNRAELIAMIRLLETAPNDSCEILIKSDSRYSIQCVTEWLPSWKNNNFRRSNGKPILNLTLLRYLDALINTRQRAGQEVTLEHVRGHSGDEGNDGADKLANLGAKKPEVSEPDWAAREEIMRNMSFIVQQSVEPVPVAGVTNPTPAYGQRRATDVTSASPAPVTPIVNPGQVMNELEEYAACLLNTDELSQDFEDTDEGEEIKRKKDPFWNW